MDDSKIVALYKRHSEQAITETVEKYGKLCYGVAYSILGVHEDAEECVNDTYVRAWEAVPEDAPDNLGAYLCRITRNLAIDKYRKSRAERRSVQTTVAFEELADCIPSGSDDLMADRLALITALNRFITSLPPRSRMIFMRRYFYMNSTKEIARMMTTTDVSVRVTLTKLRRKLKKYLCEEGIER